MTREEIIARAVEEDRRRFIITRHYCNDIDTIPYPIFELTQFDASLGQTYGLDLKQLGPHKLILELLESIKRYYDLDLSITNTFRMSPGYVKKIENAMASTMFRRWGMKSTRLPLRLEYNRYRYQNMTNDLIRLDNLLIDAREQKLTLKDSLDDGMLAYSLFIERLLSSGIDDYFDDVFISYRGLGIDKRFYNSSSGRRYNASNHPFLCMVKMLKDTSINVLSGSDNQREVIATIPWGDVELFWEYDLYHWANTMSQNRYKAHKNRDTMNCHGLKYPYHQVEHPYIQRDVERSYGLGNICFGDYHDNIVNSLHNMDWEDFHAKINEWSSLYHLGTTGPLNSLAYCKIGNLNTYTEDTNNPISNMKRMIEAGVIALRTCKNEFREKEWDAKDFEAEFCRNCSHLNDCQFYADNIDSRASDLKSLMFEYIQERCTWFQDEIINDSEWNGEYILGYPIREMLSNFRDNIAVDEETHYLDNQYITRFNQVYRYYILKKKRGSYTNSLASNTDLSQFTPMRLDYFYYNYCSMDWTIEDFADVIKRETKLKEERKRQEAAIEAATNQPDVEDGGEIADRDGEVREPSPEFVEMLQDIARRDNL